PHRPVQAGAGQTLPVGVEAHPRDRPLVAPEGQDRRAAAGVPEARRPVLAGTGHPAAVGAEARARHRAGGAPERRQRPPGAGVRGGGSAGRRGGSSGGGRSTSGRAPARTRTGRSPPALARRLPSGLKHTAVTAPACPRRVSSSCPVPASQTRAVSSAPELAT